MWHIMHLSSELVNVRTGEKHIQVAKEGVTKQYMRVTGVTQKL
jgi:hypothetical protein